jgi:hypothetical protein
MPRLIPTAGSIHAQQFAGPAFAKVNPRRKERKILSQRKALTISSDDRLHASRLRSATSFSSSICRTLRLNDIEPLYFAFQL